MFRFANTCSKKDDGNWKEDIRFLQMETGKTIASFIRQSYFKTNGQPDQDEIGLLIGCMQEDFFLGAGEYLEGEDGPAAVRFVGKKLQRMAEKMEEEGEEYTFDIFEEYLFSEMLSQLTALIHDLPDMRQNYLGQCWMRQKTISSQLVELYSYPEREAKRMAKTVCRPDQMLPDWPSFDGGSLFFWDSDFLFYFSDGFVEGIRRLTVSGVFMGYDYASVCGIFTDAGYPVPIRLVGTEAASEVRKEAVMERMKEETSTKK